MQDYRASIGALAKFPDQFGRDRQVLLVMWNQRAANVFGPYDRARSRVAAAIGHAISFVTWRSLVREGLLSNEEAAELMQAMVGAAAR